MREPEPREETNRSVNDDTTKNPEGNANNNSFVEFKPFLSPGNSKVKKRNAVGMVPAATKLNLPQYIVDGDCFKTYSIRTLSAHTAADQHKTENDKFALLWAPAFL